MLLVALGASLLRNMLAGKGTNKAEDGIARDLRSKNLRKTIILSLINFEIQNYYQNEPWFNVVYSRDNLPDKIKDATYVINLDEYSNIRSHWIALYASNSNGIYFDSLGAKHMPKILKKLSTYLLLQQRFTEERYMIEQCMDAFVLDWLILCLKVKAWQTLLIFFHQIINKNDDRILNVFENLWSN